MVKQYSYDTFLEDLERKSMPKVERTYYEGNFKVLVLEPETEAHYRAKDSSRKYILSGFCKREKYWFNVKIVKNV